SAFKTPPAGAPTLAAPAYRSPAADRPPRPPQPLPSPPPGPSRPPGDAGVFTYVVEEGQRMLMRRPNGAMEVVLGPRRVWKGWNVLLPMAHHVAHPGGYLIGRLRGRRPGHPPGPPAGRVAPRSL